MGNLSRLSNAQSRSISPENFTGEKGKGAMADPVRDKDVRNKANAAGPAKDLGKGWKVNPFIIVKPGETVTIAEIDGPGAMKRAIGEGITKTQFQENMDRFLEERGYDGLTPYHADRIFRQNMLTAYSVGHYQQMTDPDVMGRRKYWLSGRAAGMSPRMA